MTFNYAEAVKGRVNCAEAVKGHAPYEPFDVLELTEDEFWELCSRGILYRWYGEGDRD